MAGNAPNFNISIGAVTTELKKGLQEARRELQNFQKEVNSRKLNPDYKASMQAERIEGQKLTNQIKAVRLESAQLTLEQRKNKTATDAASGSYREAQQRLTALGRSIREARNGFTQNSASINKQIKEYNQLNSQLKAFDARMGNFQRNVGNYPNAMGALSALSPQISQLASKGGGYIGLALAVADAAKTMVAFDSGLRNVEKTTGLTRKETQALGDEFIGLSKKLQVVSAQGLTEYGSTAGQLGVKGTQNILNFAEALAVLEVASDIKGEEGAAQIARLLTLTDGGVQNVKQFADEIVNLGNNFAATESEILGNASRIAQSTGTYKLGREAVLAFAVATKSSGAEAEVTGSAIGRTLSALEGYARSTKGATELSKFLGISQQELNKRFKENSSGVLIDFIGALNKVDKSGGSVNQTIEDMIGKSVGIKQVIGTLATGGYDLLTDSIDKTRNSLNASTNEFATQSTKLEAQIGRIQVAWENFTLSVDKGDGIFGKTLSGLSGGLADIIDALTDIEKNDAWQSIFGTYSAKGNPILNAFDVRGKSMNFARDFWKPILGELPGAIDESTRMRVSRRIGKIKPNGQFKYGTGDFAGEIRQRTGSQTGETYNPIGFFGGKNSNYKYAYKEVAKQATVATKVIDQQSEALIKNKDFWDEQVKSITAAIEAMDASDSGTKEFIKLQKELSNAQKNLDVYSKKSLTGSSTTKGKTQAEIIKEANDALAGGQANALRGLDGELAKIDNKWAGILEKINKIADVSLRNQQAALAGVYREAEKYMAFLDTFAKTPTDFGRKQGGNVYRNVPTQLSGVLQSPTTLPLLERNQNRFDTRYFKKNTSSYATDDFSNYLQRSIRSGVANSITSIFEDIGKIAESNLEIEQKYAKLRQESTADQIEGLRKMEKLEKSINNGFTKLLQNTTASFSQLGTRTLSSAIGEGVSTGDFSQLTKLFKGDNKALGYGALASSLGGVISGVSNNPGAKTFGSILSLGGTGAAIGSTIAPGIGTIIGAAAGVIIGAISGILNTGEQKKQSELQNLQLLEQKKQTALQNRIAALSYQSSIVGQVTNQGVVTGIDRDAYGNLVATISGDELQIILNRAKNQRG